MTRSAISCNTANHGGLRGKKPEYIVIHYTAGDGDTARDNGLYFRRNAVGASAHWFVDDREAVLSVPEEFVAWHCGGGAYAHPKCRNSNSIGVELCSRKDGDGVYYFTSATEENAIALVRELMQKYGIPAGNVVRHYDVTGKICPAPYMEQDRWNKFQEALREMRYENKTAVPQWGQPTVDKLTRQGLLQGDGISLDLSRDMLRILVVLDRAGVFGS